MISGNRQRSVRWLTVRGLGRSICQLCIACLVLEKICSQIIALGNNLRKAVKDTTTHNTAWLQTTRIPRQKQDRTVCAAGMTWKLPHTWNTKPQSIQNGYHRVTAWVSWRGKTQARLRRDVSWYLSASVKNLFLHSLHRSVAEEPMEYLHIGTGENYV